VFAAIPLLALPVLAYNAYVLTLSGMVSSQEAVAGLSVPLFTMSGAGGTPWPVSLGDVLLAGSLIVLFIELLRSTTSHKIAIINHAVSMLLFVACLIELLLLPAFANSIFFLITLMVLLDVLAGFIVTIVAARRDVDFIDDR
jgi:hypothetical protein